MPATRVSWYALTKEDRVPAVNLERALKRKRLFEQDPEDHTYAHET